MFLTWFLSCLNKVKLKYFFLPQNVNIKLTVIIYRIISHQSSKKKWKPEWLRGNKANLSHFLIKNIAKIESFPYNLYFLEITVFLKLFDLSYLNTLIVLLFLLVSFCITTQIISNCDLCLFGNTKYWSQQDLLKEPVSEIMSY